MGLNCSEESMTILQRTQSKAMRAIVMFDMYTPAREMLNVLDLINVGQRMKFNVCYSI